MLSGIKLRNCCLILPGKFHDRRSLAGYSPGLQRVRHNWSNLAQYACILFSQHCLKIVFWIRMILASLLKTLTIYARLSLGALFSWALSIPLVYTSDLMPIPQALWHLGFSSWSERPSNCNFLALEDSRLNSCGPDWLPKACGTSWTRDWTSMSPHWQVDSYHWTTQGSPQLSSFLKTALTIWAVLSLEIP